MRIRTTYTVTPGHAMADTGLPIELMVEGSNLRLDRDEDEKLRVVVERPGRSLRTGVGR